MALLTQNKGKISPPISHIVKARKYNTLQCGDHIYRRSNGIKSIISYQHGVIIDAPNINKNMNNIMVISMTRKDGILVLTLSEFLNNFKCRLAYYNTKTIYSIIHASGTCYNEISDDFNIIFNRIEWINNTPTNNSLTLFNLLDNCKSDEFAFFLKTGIYRGINCYIKKINQLKLILKSEIIAEKATKTFSKWLLINCKYALSSREAAINSSTISVVSINVIIEIFCSLYKIYKYKNKRHYKYTLSDLRRDLGRNWSITTIVTAISLSSMIFGVGSLTIPASFCGGFITNCLFSYFNVLEKTQKEKFYLEKGLNINSSVFELQKVRKNIIKQIKNNKLHPDKWNNLINEKERKKRMKKFLWLRAFIDLLDKDINRGYVVFDNRKKHKKHKKRKHSITY